MQCAITTVHMSHGVFLPTYNPAKHEKSLRKTCMGRVAWITARNGNVAWVEMMDAEDLMEEHGDSARDALEDGEVENLTQNIKNCPLNEYI